MLAFYGALSNFLSIAAIPSRYSRSHLSGCWFFVKSIKQQPLNVDEALSIIALIWIFLKERFNFSLMSFFLASFHIAWRRIMNLSFRHEFLSPCLLFLSVLKLKINYETEYINRNIFVALHWVKRIHVKASVRTFFRAGILIMMVGNWIDWVDVFVVR